VTDTAKRYSVKRHFKETKAELKKVSWPSRKEVFKHTQVVLAAIVIIGLALWLVDLAFGTALNFFLMK
jgi:preprotein translocase subunit SecE